MSKTSKPILISCGIFRKEIETLENSKLLDIENVFLDSMLHMKPVKLKEELDKLIKQTPSKTPIVLLYGECHMYFDKYDDLPNVKKVEGKNCVDIILGNKRKKELFSQGAFFLMPEWLEKWQKIFEKDLGLKQDTAKELMSEMHKKLVYIDTGCVPVDIEKIEEMSKYIALPFEIEKVGLDMLLENINGAIKQLEKMGE